MRLTSFERQGFAGNKRDISTSVSTLHVILAILGIIRAGSPLRPRGIIQTGCLIARTTNISRADDTVAVCDCKVEQASGVDIIILYDIVGNTIGEFVDLCNRLLDGLSQDGRPETGRRANTRIVAQAFEGVEEQRKRPLAVGTALHTEEPLVCEKAAQAPLDVLPATQATIVHPHETAVGKRVAVVLAQGAGSGGAHMGEYESRCGLGGDSL